MKSIIKQPSSTNKKYSNDNKVQSLVPPPTVTNFSSILRNQTASNGKGYGANLNIITGSMKTGASTSIGDAATNTFKSGFGYYEPPHSSLVCNNDRIKFLTNNTLRDDNDFLGLPVNAQGILPPGVSSNPMSPQPVKTGFKNL